LCLKKGKIKEGKKERVRVKKDGKMKQQLIMNLKLSTRKNTST